MSDTPPPMKLPRLVDEDRDQLWLRCFVDGKDRECEISIDRAWEFHELLGKWLKKASRR